mmetsp:Transcript_502/g.1065  ORF Transcript_502/g.1065 Transcript_502/m.1065 type:complete len:200 (+) Transcript_502:626-1225(+)
MQRMWRCVHLQAWQTKVGLQGMRRGLDLPAWTGEIQVQGVWRSIHLQPWSNPFLVQRMRWCFDMSAQQAQIHLQGMRWGILLHPRPEEVVVQGVRNVCTTRSRGRSSGGCLARAGSAAATRRQRPDADRGCARQRRRHQWALRPDASWLPGHTSGIHRGAAKTVRGTGICRSLRVSRSVAVVDGLCVGRTGSECNLCAV